MNVLGFMPDADPATPGVLTDVSNVIPTNTGMKGAPVPVAATGVPALAATCRNAAVATKLDGTRRVIAGTASNLYELSGGSWSSVSRVGNYSLGADDRWDIAQFGDATLAASITCPIQRSTSGAFADISGAPKATIIETTNAFVLAFNTNDGTYGVSHDRWWCSAAYNDTDWTPSVTTQCTTGQLVSTPGPITAAKTLGDQIVAYKERAVYIGQYVGAPVVWQWTQIPGDIGCVGQDAVTDIGPAHIFVARNSIYIFDGTRPVSIADGQVRQWFYDNSDPTYLYRTQVVHDKQKNNVWIFFPSNGSAGALDSALVFNLATKQWGRSTQTIEAALNYVSTGATFDTLTGTFDTLPDVGWDSGYWLAGTRQLSVFDTSHQLNQMTGITSSSSFTTHLIGDDMTVSRLKALRVGWQDEPDTASAAGVHTMVRGSTLTGSGTSPYADGKFNLRQSARWHQVTVSTTGNMAFNAYEPELQMEGSR